MDFVFIHINKTGGSSIEKALGVQFEHKTAWQKRAELGRAAWKRAFSFAFVRNPWDRTVSHYHHRLLTNQTGLRDNTPGFNEWVKLAYGERAPVYYDKPKMFMPQWHWLIDRKGKLLVDYIGRFENLQADFAHVCLRLNRHATLPHLKKSARGGYREYYNETSIAIVRQWFAIDIEMFKYEF